MKSAFTRAAAMACAALVSVAFAQGPIVVSDGPETTGQANSKNPNIITTDGPSKLAYSYPPPIITSDGPSELPYQTLSGIVTSDGPGAHPLAVKPAETKELPNPEASTLAPAVPVGQSVTTLPEPTVEKQVVLGGWTPVHDNDFFYVYSDKRKSGNHFIPSGWMGDYSDIHFNDASTENPHSGDTCIKITYSPRSPQGSGWVGMYWQTPANNWGDRPGGFDLTGKRRLTFWARGAKGGEVIAEFKMGGIGGQNGDSDSVSTGSIVLSKEWQKYTVGLADRDLHHIIGGFCWSATRDSNPNGMTFYLDDIRYE
jgi:hypothetical protein